MLRQYGGMIQPGMGPNISTVPHPHYSYINCRANGLQEGGGICSLYKRGLWVTPCAPNVDNGRDPSVIKRSPSVQFSKCEAPGRDNVGG